ncbi:hypothetical protein [Bartonella queenslandensis]|uniref:hypothetical protein n=1 Tax=Bartonella queenslandensis TaxID=481138 RepID=UPI0005842D87|nr:hypothetical protein [Bartonella queenslandensis]
MQEQNWVSEQEMYKRAHSFSFQQALLSAKDYKIIFAIAVIIVIWRVMLEIPEIFNWQLIGWQYVVHTVILKTTGIIIVCALLLIPIMSRLRTKVTCELQENIQKLEEALFEREQISSLPHGLCK